MRVVSSRFVTSASSPRDYPEGDIPEIAFAGRSNVGKSSLINMLINRRQLAKTSRTPGKTRTVNFYLVNDSLSLVDLPGYGYARLSRAELASWGRMIESYLESRPGLRGVTLLLDIRHPLSPLDRQMLDWLSHRAIPLVMAATKSDKESASSRARKIASLCSELGLSDVREIIPVSSRTGLGKSVLWSRLMGLLP